MELGADHGQRVIQRLRPHALLQDRRMFAAVIRAYFENFYGQRWRRQDVLSHLLIEVL